MSILVNRQTRVICQGMTGRAGSQQTAAMMKYGTNVVAGVTPGKGGQRHLDLPIFDTVSEAVQQTRANASVIFAPPMHAAAAMIEAIEAEVPLVVTLTEHVPVLDMVRVCHALKGSQTRLVGPNSEGILAPGVCKLGVIATGNVRPGGIGVVSRSASLTSEVIAQISAAGLGLSTSVGVGGDLVHGLTMKDCVELFLADEETEGIVLIGEVGGTEEQYVADLLRQKKPRVPVVALVVGSHAPSERRAGNAGALLVHGRDTAAAKIAALGRAGVTMAESPHLVGETMSAALRKHKDQNQPRSAAG